MQQYRAYGTCIGGPIHKYPVPVRERTSTHDTPHPARQWPLMSTSMCTSSPNRRTTRQHRSCREDFMCRLLENILVDCRGNQSVLELPLTTSCARIALLPQSSYLPHQDSSPTPQLSSINMSGRSKGKGVKVSSHSPLSSSRSRAHSSRRVSEKAAPSVTARFVLYSKFTLVS